MAILSVVAGSPDGTRLAAWRAFLVGSFALGAQALQVSRLLPLSLRKADWVLGLPALAAD